MKLEIDWLEMAKAVAKAIWPFIAGAFGGTLLRLHFRRHWTQLHLVESWVVDS